jgi:hypothetical protein
MLIHASIPATDTQRVAAVIAELWQGFSTPFPLHPGSYVALAGDERGTEIEVRPHDPASASGDTGQSAGHPAPPVAIATPLTEEQVLAIAAREGWFAQRCNRDGQFHVIECWLENCFPVEVLTAEMQREYGASVAPVNWQRVFDGMESLTAA